jgi:hypothetical protein
MSTADETNVQAGRTEGGRRRWIWPLAAMVLLVVGVSAWLALRDTGPELGATTTAHPLAPFTFSYPAAWHEEAGAAQRDITFVTDASSVPDFDQSIALGDPAVAVYSTNPGARTHALLELQATSNGGTATSASFGEIDDAPAVRWRVTLPPEATYLFPSGIVMTGYDFLVDGHSLTLVIESSEASVDDELFDAIAASVRFDDELVAQLPS